MPTFRRTARRAARTGVQPEAGAREVAGAPEAEKERGSPGSGATVARPAEVSAIEQVRAELIRLGARHAPLAGSEVEPMLAETADAPFSRKGWLFELKIDGFRAIAAKHGARVTLHYRRGREATEIYPDLARALAALPIEALVLDGEIAVLDVHGLPSFQRLQKRALFSQPLDVAQAAKQQPAVYFAFDLLGFEDFDLRALPLVERKRLLGLLLPRSGVIGAVDAVPEHGEALYASATAAGLEGVMAKRADAPYAAGRSGDWRKVRASKSGDFAIVGFTEGEGARKDGFGALHVAQQGEGGLVYVGRVGSGFTEKSLHEIRALLDPLRLSAPPCTGPVPRTAGNVWVEARHLCEVRYHQITEEGLLRQPVFLRLREDKSEVDSLERDEGEIHREKGGVVPVRAVNTGKAGVSASAIGESESERKIKFSNPQKVLWPGEGTTKGELVDYYRVIAPRMLPWLRDRALTLTRYPDGIEGKFFFQKNAPAHTPKWIRTARVMQAEERKAEQGRRRPRWGEGTERKSEGPIDAIVCDDEATLLYCANLAAIPLHVPANRISTGTQCDYCVIDLDPKEAPFAHVVEIARALHELCESIQLPGFIKTSGQKGLHVLLPLGGACDHEESKTLGELIARCIEQRLPKISTTERIIEARKGRVYLDYLQNGDGKTIVAAYSVRPVPGATVSTPLLWSEVNDKLDPRAFTVRTMPERARKLGADPALAALSLKPDLPAVLARLTRELGRKGS